MYNCVVNESSKNIRYLARQALKGNWKTAALASLIFLACLVVPTLIIEVIFGDYSMEAMQSAETLSASSGVTSLYAILVSGAFTFGISYCFIQLFRTGKTDPGHVFSGFDYFFKTIGLYLVMSVFVFLWTLLLIVPGIIAQIRYSQAFMILADDPSKGIMQCINESKAMMNGNKAKFFCLQLSFTGWYLLAIFAVYLVLIIFIFGTVFLLPYADDAAMYFILVLTTVLMLGALTFVLPYVQTANTVFYEMARGALRRADEPAPPVIQPLQ